MVESQKRPEPEATRAGNAAAGLHNKSDGHVFDAAHGAGIDGVVKPALSAGRNFGNVTAEQSASSDGPSVPLQSNTGQAECQTTEDKKRPSPHHLRRKSKTKNPPGPASNIISAPVLVNPSPFPPNMPSRSTSRRLSAVKSSSSSAAEPKHALPPLSAFSFSEILASIDSDVSADINKIAEICGKSKLSMANEYGSHLPPHGARDQIIEQDEDIEDDRPALGLEETAQSHWQGTEEGTRGRRWELLRRGRVGAGRAVTGTTDITSTATLDSMQRPEPGDRHVVDAIPSPAVRHLQALTRVA